MTRLRSIVQATLFALFVVVTVWPMEALSTRAFFRIDAVSTATSSLSEVVAVGAVLAALLLIITYFFGRIFCGWVCPMGAAVDFMDTLTGLKPRATNLRWFKNHLLLVLIGLTVGGISLAWLLDPLVWASRLGSLFSPTVVEPLFVLATVGAFLAIQLVFGQRGFCRILCPLGALLAAVAKGAAFRRTVNSDCTDCGTCVTHCPTVALRPGPKDFYPAACIHCRACDTDCPADAISFDYRPLSIKPAHPIELRRSFLVSFAGGAALALGGRLAFAGEPETEQLRPPGTVSEKDLLNQCIRCGACVRVCPTQTLVSSSAPDRWALTPELVARRGGCLYDCNDCGEVCPTGAIRALPLVVKRTAPIGVAVFDETRCLPHTIGRACLTCAAACPFEAIRFEEFPAILEWGDKLLLPEIVPDRCTGCGLCEASCPIIGKAAVRIVAQ